MRGFPPNFNFDLPYRKGPKPRRYAERHEVDDVIKHFEAQFWTEVQKAARAHMHAIDSDANADRSYLMGLEDGMGARREIDSVADKYKNAIHTRRKLKAKNLHVSAQSKPPPMPSATLKRGRTNSCQGATAEELFDFQCLALRSFIS